MTLLLAGVVVIAFLLAVWWLAFHPDFGAPPERRRPGPAPRLDRWAEMTLRNVGMQWEDPGEIRTEMRWR